ncbi:hypothetical protein GCM10010272_53980 [Streptomyces lateritius]|nr:hypothetical protein GCM10010272_53980 [Streptomyces lateritius]
MPYRRGLPLKAPEDVFAYAEGVELRFDGAETQVRRPQAGCPGRCASVAGKCKQNTIKTTTFSDGRGRMLLSGVARPGRMHDQPSVRTEGIAERFRLRPWVRAQAYSECQGLAKEVPEQVTVPPAKPRKDACDGDRYAWREARRRQSSARICVEHTNAGLRQWAPSRRFAGLRESYGETHAANAGPVRCPRLPPAAAGLPARRAGPSGTDPVVAAALNT